MQLRICDLGLKIKGTVLENRVARLGDELESREFRFRPHCWLSEEWFSPDGIPGIAIPFYLAHPRLMRLERKQMLEVEGGTESWCMQILRHEAGHTLDTAYRLYRRNSWRKVFGKHTKPYPEHYRPKPYSKNFVMHLEPWYAQSHPSEDFAETFAVWFKPRSRWRSQYQEWPAFKKLTYVSELMQEIRHRKPQVVSRKFVDPITSIRKTLGEHYEEKRRRYGIEHPTIYDHDLKRLFSDKPQNSRRLTAAAFLRRHRTTIRRAVARWTNEYHYTIDQALGEMIRRCRQLDLRLDRPAEQVKHDALVLLTVQTMNYLHGGHHRVAL